MKGLQNPGPAVGNFFMRTSNALNSNATSTTATGSVENASTVEAASEDATGLAPPPSRGSLNQHLTTSKPTRTIKSFVSYNPTQKYAGQQKLWIVTIPTNLVRM